MPATTEHSSQRLEWYWSDNNISVNEAKRAVATPPVGSASMHMRCMPSEVGIQQCNTICHRHCECVWYVPSEYTLTTNLSLLPAGMDISLDRTIVPAHGIFILFTTVCPWGLVLAFIGIKGIQYSPMSGCQFNMVLASTKTIVYFRLNCRVLAGWYAWSVLPNGDFHF